MHVPSSSRAGKRCIIIAFVNGLSLPVFVFGQMTEVLRVFCLQSSWVCLHLAQLANAPCDMNQCIMHHFAAFSTAAMHVLS